MTTIYIITITMATITTITTITIILITYNQSISQPISQSVIKKGWGKGKGRALARNNIALSCKVATTSACDNNELEPQLLLFALEARAF